MIKWNLCRIKVKWATLVCADLKAKHSVESAKAIASIKKKKPRFFDVHELPEKSLISAGARISVYTGVI